MTEKGKLTGWHVLAMLVAFFGVMIVANVTFITAAIESFPGVTDEHAYDKGLKYNETLSERAEQAELGWRAEVLEVSRDGAAGVITLRIASETGPLKGLRVAGTLKRPASGKEDQTLAFEYAGEGLYEAKVDAFAPGAWDLTARAEGSAGETFDIAARIIAE
ncbi:MAG: FixH family protein [Parvularculaceae bacterium]